MVSSRYIVYSRILVYEQYYIYSTVYYFEAPLHLKSACSLEEKEEKVVKLRLYVPNVAQHLFGLKLISVTSHSQSYLSPPATLPGPSSGARE